MDFCRTRFLVYRTVRNDVVCRVFASLCEHHLRTPFLKQNTDSLALYWASRCSALLKLNGTGFRAIKSQNRGLVYYFTKSSIEAKRHSSLSNRLENKSNIKTI